MIMYVPIIAAGEGQIISLIIFAVIWVVGWLIKNMKQNADQPRVQAPGRRGNDKIRSEIDSFLNEVTGRKPQQQQPQNQRDNFLEMVDDEKPRRQQQPQRDQRRQKQRQQPARKPLAERGDQTFGGSLQEHVADHMQLQHYEEDLTHDVNASVSQHLGVFDVVGDADQLQVESVHERTRKEVVEMLRNPEDVRKGILLNLVLSPPVGLKRK